MTKKEAIKEFRAFYLPHVPKNDKPALQQTWNDYTDYLQKDGRISERQCATWSQPDFVSK